MLARWSERLAVGHDVIDTQHKELFVRLNDFLESMGSGKQRENMEQTLTFLGEYVIVHFETEEELMEKYNYPGATAHKAEHKKFIHTFGEIKDRFEKHNRPSYLALQMDVGLQTINWLYDHIGKTDAAFGRFLAKQK